MKSFAKYALGAALLTGAAFAAASPAAAQVSFSVQFSSPSYGRYYAPPPPPPRTYCDPRNRYFRACDNSGYWNEPVFYRGHWYTQPLQFTFYQGTRIFWIDNGWRRDEWRGGPRPRPNYNQPGYGYGPGYGPRR